MLVYMKIVDGVKKLFGTLDKVPAPTDKELIYKDADGDSVTPVANDTYLDDGEGGIIRKSDGKFVAVQIDPASGDDVTIIPNSSWEPADKVLTKITVAGFSKTTYEVGDTLKSTDALKNVVVTAYFESGEKEVGVEYTTSPTDTTALATTDTVVVFSYTVGEVTKTVSKAITVEAAPEPGE